MRPQKVLDDDVLAGLTRVFRARGYEGASLKEIAEETGLKKASLYHRFPDGKKQMAEAVIDHIDEWVERHIFQTLIDERITPEHRLTKGIQHIRALYDGGVESCIFRTLSMQIGMELFGNQIQSGMKQWIHHFEKLGSAFGQSKSEAKKTAVQNIIDIQGSLIVSECLADIDVFEKTLKNIKKRYLN